MKMKKVLLATTISLALGGATQVANAGVYGASYLEIVDLGVLFTADGQTPGGAAVTGFNINSTNTAFINDIGGATSASCAGGAPGTGNCGPEGAVLDAAVYNAPGSNPLQVENNFLQFGPGGDQYSHADSIVANASLANPTGPLTESIQLAQSEIQTADSANANATLSSATDVTMFFTVDQAGTMIFTFNAYSYLESDVNLAGDQTGISQADVSFNMQLSADDGSAFIIFNPNGDAINSCGGFGVICTEFADGGDLNNSANISGNAGNQTLIADGLFGVQVDGLYAGDWTLSISAITKTNLSRIPEPGTMMLFGLGLLGLAGARRKAKR